MSVEGPINIIAMHRSPSLSIDPASHHHISESPLSAASISRPVQMLAPQLRRERAQSTGDVAATPSSAQPIRRATSPLVAQVGIGGIDFCVMYVCVHVRVCVCERERERECNCFRISGACVA